MRSKKQNLLLSKKFLRRGLFWLLLCLLFASWGSLLAQDTPTQETEAPPLPTSTNPVDATLEKIRMYYGLGQFDKVMYECQKMDKLDPGNKMVVYYRTRAEEKLKEMGLLDKLKFTPEPTPTPLPARTKVPPPDLPALSPTPASGTAAIGTPPAPGEGMPVSATPASGTPSSDNPFEPGATPATTAAAMPIAATPAVAAPLEENPFGGIPVAATPAQTAAAAAPTAAAPAATTAPPPPPPAPSEPVPSGGGGLDIATIGMIAGGVVAAIAVVLVVIMLMKKIRATSKIRGSEQKLAQTMAQTMAQPAPRQGAPAPAAPKPAPLIQHEIPDFPDVDSAPQTPGVASIPSPSSPADELPPRSGRRMPPPDFAPPSSQLPEIPELPEIPDIPSPISSVPVAQGLPPIPDLMDIPSPTQIPDLEPAPAKPDKPAPLSQTPPDLPSLDFPVAQPEADVFSFALAPESGDLKIPVDEAPEPEHPLESPTSEPIVSSDPFAHLDVDLTPPPPAVPVPEGVPKEPPSLSIEEALGLAPPSAPAPESMPSPFDTAPEKTSASSTSMDLDSFLFSTPSEEQAETMVARPASQPDPFSFAPAETRAATGSFDSMMFGDETDQATQLAEPLASPEPPAPPKPAPKPAPAPAPKPSPALESEEKPLADERGLGQFSVESLEEVSPENEKKAPLPPRKKIEERNEALFADQYKKGSEAFEKGDWKKAVHYLSVAAAIRPDVEDLKNMLATARQNKRAAEQS